MKGNDYYRVPCLGHQKPDMQMLMNEEGGVAAYGRWHILLGILYQTGGRMELDNMAKTYLVDQLQYDGIESLLHFLGTLAKVGCISAEFLNRNIITSEGVCDQLAYLDAAREAGKRGGRKAKG